MKKLEEFTAETLLNEAEKFSKKMFADKENLFLVFQVGLKKENRESFEHLVFTAKYIRGLKRVIEKGAGLPDVNNLEDVKKDLSENMLTVVNILKELNSSMPEEKKELFENIYLKMTAKCISNLYTLLEGLEWTKMYLNELKGK